MKKVLEARTVRKTFEEGSQRVEVLRGVSLDVSEGEIVSLEAVSYTHLTLPTKRIV